MDYKVPKSGRWNNEENVAYTTSFDCDRKMRNAGARFDQDNFRKRGKFAEKEALVKPPAPVGRTKAQRQQPKAIQHGAQESTSNVGYTASFDLARKKKHHGLMINASEIHLNQTPPDQNTGIAATIPKWGDWDKNHETQKENGTQNDKGRCCPWF